MKTSAQKALFALVESFFLNYLPRQRGASPHTTRAYRDTLKLLFQFVAQRRGKEMVGLLLEDLDGDTIACFLDHLERDRANSTATRNYRRAALRSFFKHLLRNDLDNALRYTRVLALPAKRAQQKPVVYLEAIDVRAIIGKPDRRTNEGCRDHTLLLFLYNSAARVSEATGMLWRDLQLTPPCEVRLRGKGRKERIVPIWRETTEALRRLRKLSDAADHEHVFLNRHNQPLTRDGVAYILEKYVGSASCERPTLGRVRITPHVFRHSAAVALLQSGTDVTVIRDYLGHSSIVTTNRYISTNLKMRRDAIETFWQHAGIETIKDKPWKPKQDLLSFLQSL
ncbi:site-specific integrase [Asaia sp. As-1742]|uniref:site-specific integrase n=1 Tax=Asaia sp. As-1742 TaxID=2608325 RepID=UPI00142116F4|nr:site-specific integrase [Asaia sp. As-1742]NIE81393.1 tyrosine-type recombinase/integrase [Asaia sp. As-1742]